MTKMYTYICKYSSIYISGNRVAMHRSFSFMDFIKLGAVVIGVTVVSFAPFIYFVSISVTILQEISTTTQCYMSFTLKECHCVEILNIEHPNLPAKQQCT